MTIDRTVLARAAARAAMNLRSEHQRSDTSPVNPFDLAEEIGVQVRFVDLPSLEGMYIRSPFPQIFLSTLRPRGRRAYTCAHELGHHIFGHGINVQEYKDGPRERSRLSPAEFSADVFAAYLLMPKLAVMSAFARRGWDSHEPSSEQIFVIAKYLGVGYTSLLSHLMYSLNLITRAKYEALMRITPASIVQALAPGALEKTIVIVDQYWTDNSVDCEVGDLLSLPGGTRPKARFLRCVSSDSTKTVVKVIAPGVGMIANGDTIVLVRAARKDYVGFNCYKFMEDDENDA